ncbi:hypothetical protein PTHTG4_08160 [Parageobacillus thermoglucosidasius]|nr:hypothetical protein PTHTG4_08160 [Parageobacillus thermoglucosidasius]
MTVPFSIYLFHIQLILRFHTYFRRYDQCYGRSNHNPHHHGKHPIIPPLSSFYSLFYTREQTGSARGFEQFMKFRHS